MKSISQALHHQGLVILQNKLIRVHGSFRTTKLLKSGEGKTYNGRSAQVVHKWVAHNYFSARVRRISRLLESTFKDAFVGDALAHDSDIVSSHPHPHLIRLVASEVVDFHKIRVHCFPLDQVNAAVLEASTLKGLDWAILEPNK